MGPPVAGVGDQHGAVAGRAARHDDAAASPDGGGTRIDAVISKDLLVSLFFPQSPLHDGAVIIRGSGILAAGCLLPLPADHHLRTEFLTRTRHLAAIGLSLETDAAVVVVSEATGRISLAVKGDLVPILETDDLRKRLLEHMKT